MTEYLAQRLTALLFRKLQIEEEEFELYELGMEVIVSTSYTAAAILLMALLFGHLAEAVIFLVCFMTLRNYSGGYHAKTRVLCFVTSLLCYLSVEMLAFLLTMLPGSLFPGMIIMGLFVNFVVFWCIAPQENPNKKLTPGWKKHNRFMTLLILLFDTMIALLGLCLENSMLSRQIWATLMEVQILLWLAKKGRYDYEKEYGKIDPEDS